MITRLLVLFRLSLSHEPSDLTPTISLSPPAFLSPCAHVRFTFDALLRRRCVYAQKSPISHPFEGAGTRGETSFDTVQRARAIVTGGRARSRFLRHAQWARCDTRAIIRARRLDTFNCHVNLFVPLPIEGGRAFSREISPRPAKNPARGRHTMDHSQSDSS